METKHKNAPWTIKDDRVLGGAGLVIWSANQGIVALLGNHSNDADAALISASPDLLAALIELAPSMPPEDALCHKGICSQRECANCSRVAKALAAIAKATGQEAPD